MPPMTQYTAEQHRYAAGWIEDILENAAPEAPTEHQITSLIDHDPDKYPVPHIIRVGLQAAAPLGCRHKDPVVYRSTLSTAGAIAWMQEAAVGLNRTASKLAAQEAIVGEASAKEDPAGLSSTDRAQYRITGEQLLAMIGAAPGNTPSVSRLLHGATYPHLLVKALRFAAPEKYGNTRIDQVEDEMSRRDQQIWFEQAVSHCVNVANGQQDPTPDPEPPASDPPAPEPTEADKYRNAGYALAVESARPHLNPVAEIVKNARYPETVVNALRLTAPAWNENRSLEEIQQDMPLADNYRAWLIRARDRCKIMCNEGHVYERPVITDAQMRIAAGRDACARRLELLDRLADTFRLGLAICEGPAGLGSVDALAPSTDALQAALVIAGMLVDALDAEDSVIAAGQAEIDAGVSLASE